MSLLEDSSGYGRTTGNIPSSISRCPNLDGQFVPFQAPSLSFPSRHIAFRSNMRTKDLQATTDHFEENALMTSSQRHGPAGSFNLLPGSPQPQIPLYHDNPRTPIQRLPIIHITHPPRIFRPRLTPSIQIPQNMRRRHNVSVPQYLFADCTSSPFRYSILPYRDPCVQMIHVGSVFGTQCEVVHANGLIWWERRKDL